MIEDTRDRDEESSGPPERRGEERSLPLLRRTAAIAAIAAALALIYRCVPS